MLHNFLQFIAAQNLFQPADRILLTVSGGIDSVVMAYLFKDAGYSFAIAHCNFRLRGIEADNDELFVEALANTLQVPFYVKRFNTQAFASENRLSIQMAARELRYKWFEELTLQEGYRYIATAHHKNDVIETIILNLTKGTGIAGLHGIKAKTGKIIRPLLFATKAMLENYASEKNLTFRLDSSNESDKYQRNFIRLYVVPLLKKINPELENTIETTVEKITAVENIFTEKVEEVRSQIVLKQAHDIYIKKNDILQLKQPLIILFEILKDYGFNYLQVKDIVDKLTLGAGKLFKSPSHTLNVDRENVIVSPVFTSASPEIIIRENDKMIESDFFRLKIVTESNNSFEITGDKSIAMLDRGKLKFPLTLRKWKDGDKFYPLGMRKKKKLSDFMIDEKIPLNLKERVHLLLSGGDVVWVIGYRIDDRYKVTEETKFIFKIQKV